MYLDDDVHRHVQHINLIDRGRNLAREAQLEEVKPALSFRTHRGPFTDSTPDPNTSRLLAYKPFHLVTASGIPIMWYLPDTISRARQEIVFNDLEAIAPVLRHSIVHRSKTDWRNSSYLFKPDNGLLRAAPGCINVSPAWFAQGHNVSFPCSKYAGTTKFFFPFNLS